MTETETEIRGGTRFEELEAPRARSAGCVRATSRAAADAAASALEGDALHRTRDRLTRVGEGDARFADTRRARNAPTRRRRRRVAVGWKKPRSSRRSPQSAYAATPFWLKRIQAIRAIPASSSAFDAKRRVSPRQSAAAPELVDAAHAFFERVREDEEGSEEERNPIKKNGHSSSDGESEADAARLVLELEDRVAELERDLDACRRGAKGDDGGTDAGRALSKIENIENTRATVP